MREDGGAALKVVVRLGSALRTHAGGSPCLEFDLPAPVSVGDILDAVDALHPAIGRRVRDEAGTMRRHVNVFVGSDNMRDLDSVGTIVPEGAEVALLPAISGGG